MRGQGVVGLEGGEGVEGGEGLEGARANSSMGVVGLQPSNRPYSQPLGSC